MSERKDEPPTDAEDAAIAARRKLLKLTVYAAPAIVGTLLLSGDAAAAASCFPQVICNPCAPCNPACWPRCRPN